MAHFSCKINKDTIMQSITIKNRSIQFDCNVSLDVITQSEEMIAAINEVLAQRFPDVQPQIMEGKLDLVDDIEIGESDIES